MGIRKSGGFIVGEQRIFAGALPASGWLECDHGLYDGAIYPALYAEIGIAYNTGGEPAGFFRVPDKRGRGSIGRGQGSGLTNRTKGQKIGAESVALTTAQMPNHAHSDYYQATNKTTDNLFASNPTPAKTAVTGVTEAGASTTTGANGSGSTHSNMPPVEVDVWGIKF